MTTPSTIYQGDCLSVMPTINENLVDAIVTDPPYGLGFMGKSWDHGVPGIEFWKAAFRVAKPGAFLLAFGGTRTSHRLTCAIEDAGFEIRDCMMWLYGSGFPKSHDVSKAIDKAAGIERNNAPHKRTDREGYRFETQDTPALPPSTDAAKEWSGWGTALKPAWEPIIVARKPLEGTVAENVEKWGCGAMNIDGSRIETDWANDPTKRGWQGKPGNGWHVDGGEEQIKEPNKNGRWPANVILDEEAGAMLDEQSGTIKPHGKPSTNSTFGGAFGNGSKANSPNQFMGEGGASRFFYCAKASKSERGEGNNHPTVKPISLLNYLLRLVCPVGGIVLDPFMGSGSTGIAAINCGHAFIGIEKESAYISISKDRLVYADLKIFS